jgi:hypothetical protein
MVNRKKWAAYAQQLDNTENRDAEASSENSNSQRMIILGDSIGAQQGIDRGQVRRLLESVSVIRWW